MNKTIFAFLVALATVASASDSFYVRIRPLGDGTSVITGLDGGERRAVMLSVDEYELLTNQVAAAWKSVNSTESGRVSIHGKRVKASAMTAPAAMVFQYADGYIHTEPVKTAENAKPKKPEPRRERKPAWMSEAQWEFRNMKIKDAKRSVTVEYDAVTGETKEVK